jgi:hypothetical protein
MKRSVFVVLALTSVVAEGVSVSACTDGVAQARAQQANSAARRERPSSRAIERAFARVQEDVTRCLTSDVGAVRIVGSFDGDDGAFALESVRTSAGAEPPFAVATCVRTTIEQARVRPFRAESERVEREFSAGAAVVTSDAGAAVVTSGPSIPTANGNGVVTTGALRFGAAPEDLVRREHDALQRCFEQASEQAPSLEGELEIRFTLDGRGRVVQSSHRVVREHNGNGLLSLVGDCIEAHVRLIAFGPQADGGASHVVPIAFSGREHFGPAQMLPVE